MSIWPVLQLTVLYQNKNDILYLFCADVLLFSRTHALQSDIFKLLLPFSFLLCTKSLEGRKIIVLYHLIGCRTQNFVKFGWGWSFIWRWKFTRWLKDSWLTNKYEQRKRILPCDFLCSLTQRGRPYSEVLEITQCLEITRHCQRYGASIQTSIQVFDLGKGWLTGWLANWPPKSQAKLEQCGWQH